MVLIDAKGSELGLFDEAGSVYSNQIKLAKVNGVSIEDLKNMIPNSYE